MKSPMSHSITRTCFWVRGHLLGKTVFASWVARHGLGIVNDDSGVFFGRFSYFIPACLNLSRGAGHEEVVNVNDEVRPVFGVPIARLPFQHFSEAALQEMLFTMSLPIAATVGVTVKCAFQAVRQANAFAV